MTALYNEIDEFAASWLEQLIAEGQIAPGVVDRRSIEDLDPDYVRRFRQVHLFAGIGVWSLALRRAGWSDDRPVWTASCPCQPFSGAGKGDGFADERHLWPAAFHLITQCDPDLIFGEQVNDAGGQKWLDLVQSDVEAAGFAFGAVPFPAAGSGAPHIRLRTDWCAVRLADADNARLERRWFLPERAGERLTGPGSVAGGLALPHDTVGRSDLAGRNDCDGGDAGRPQGPSHTGAGGGSSGVGQPAHAADSDGRPGERSPETGTGSDGERRRGLAGGGADDGLDPRGVGVADTLTAVARISGPARLTADGRLLTGSTAGMNAGGQLNPAHSRWLMLCRVPWEQWAPGYNDWLLWQALTSAALPPQSVLEPEPCAASETP